MRKKKLDILGNFLCIFLFFTCFESRKPLIFSRAMRVKSRLKGKGIEIPEKFLFKGQRVIFLFQMNQYIFLFISSTNSNVFCAIAF